MSVTTDDIAKRFGTTCYRQFVCYFYFVGWSHISIGLSINVSLPDFELHLPFGFVRFGFVKAVRGAPTLSKRFTVENHSIGLIAKRFP